MADEIKAKIVFDTSSLQGSFGGSGGGGVNIPSGSTGGIGAFMTKGLGGALTKLALPLMALKTIAEGITKLVSILKEASPYLKATMDVGKKTLMLFFKPFGDMLATLLRPALIWLLRMAIKWQSMWGPTAQKKGQEALEESGLTPETVLDKFSIPKPGDELKTPTVSGGGLLTPEMKEKLKEAWDNFVLGIGEGLEDFKTWTNEIWSKFKTWIGDSWGDYTEWKAAIWNRFVSWLGESWGKTKEWTQAVWLRFTSWIGKKWGTFKEWADAIWTNFTDWLGQGWDTIGSFAKMIWSAAKKWVSDNISSLIGGKKDKGEKQDFISRPGMGIQSFSPQDTIIGFKGNAPGGLGGTNITVNVNALDGDSITEAALRKISNAVQDAIKSDMAGMSSQVYGMGG